MTIQAAGALLRTPLIDWTRSQVWADLGCGEGLFTLTLATLLAPSSTIYAVDRNQPALGRIPDEHKGVSIRKFSGDLNSDSLQLPPLDGVLIANALHFIPEQDDLLRRLLGISERFLIVEYERSQSSKWGPYPVNFEKLRKLFQTAGVHSVTQIGTRKSRFGGMIYSALAEAVTLDKEACR